MQVVFSVCDYPKSFETFAAQSTTRVPGNMIRNPEDGDSMFLRNFGIHRRFYKAPKPIILPAL
jgi:hypothetical protein